MEEPRRDLHPYNDHREITEETESAATGQGPQPSSIKMLRSAKLVADDREQLCIVRELTCSGATINMLGPIPLHDSLLLEIGNNHRFPVTIDSCRGNHCQLRFANPGDRQRFLAEASDELNRRPLRLRTNEEIAVILTGLRFPATLLDVSQFGAGIRCAKILHIGEVVQLETGMLPMTLAKIAWRRRDRYGLLFLQHFTSAQIAEAFASSRTRRGAPGDHPPDPVRFRAGPAGLFHRDFAARLAGRKRLSLWLARGQKAWQQWS